MEVLGVAVGVVVAGEVEGEAEVVLVEEEVEDFVGAVEVDSKALDVVVAEGEVVEGE